MTTLVHLTPYAFTMPFNWTCPSCFHLPPSPPLLTNNRAHSHFSIVTDKDDIGLAKPSPWHLSATRPHNTTYPSPTLLHALATVKDRPAVKRDCTSRRLLSHLLSNATSSSVRLHLPSSLFTNKRPFTPFWIATATLEMT